MTMPTGDAQTSPPTHDGSAPPLPHAAPAPAAADAGGDGREIGRLIRSLNKRVGADEGATPYETAAACDALERMTGLRAAEILRAEAAEAERDRLGAELAAVRGAMPDPQMLDMYAEGIEWEGYEAIGLRKAAARIRALAAAPTPPAAEAGTGDLLREAASLLDALAPVAGRDRNEAEDLIGRIGACLGHSAAALDTPQEADHAAR